MTTSGGDVTGSRAYALAPTTLRACILHACADSAYQNRMSGFYTRAHTQLASRAQDRRALQKAERAMGTGESRQQESSSNYDVKSAGGEGAQELPRDLHAGPIHQASFSFSESVSPGPP